ncbi:hypothetical protein JCM11491_001706 [Sporobolomyces phaffii]
MSTSEFSFEPPPRESVDPLSAFDSFLGSHLPSTSSATLSILSSLAHALYIHQVGAEVNKELDQLRGELRDEFRPRVKALKADYMARIVWDDGDSASTPDGEQEQARIAHPTIMSDVDEQTNMSAEVDRATEHEIETSMNEAKNRIEQGVRKTRHVELEIWLSGVILDAYDDAAGDETEAARWIQSELEESLAGVGIDPESVSRQSSQDLNSRFSRVSVTA